MLQVYGEKPQMIGLDGANLNPVYLCRYKPILETLIVNIDGFLLSRDSFTTSEHDLRIAHENFAQQGIEISYLTLDTEPMSGVPQTGYERDVNKIEVVSSSTAVAPKLVPTNYESPKVVGRRGLFYMNLDNFHQIQNKMVLETSLLSEHYGATRFPLHRGFEFSNGSYDVFSQRLHKEIRELQPYGKIEITNQEYRPDLVSFDVYGMCDFWNILMFYNNIPNVLDINIGLTVNFPKMGDVENIYFRMQNRQRINR
jgi:hypothetical protein